MITPKIWDSDFFQFKVGEIKKINKTELLKIINDKVKKFKFLFIELEKKKNKKINFLLKKKFKIADNRLYFSKNLKTKKDRITLFNKKIFSIKKLTIKDFPKLKKISRNLFTESRFFQDKKFNTNQIKKLYNTWIYRALCGQFDDFVYGFYKNNILIGFCSFAKKNKALKIGLVGLKKKYSGIGLGQIFFELIFIKMRKNYNYLNAVTQFKNLNAVKFYYKMGFKKIKETSVLHLWLKK